MKEKALPHLPQSKRVPSWLRVAPVPSEPEPLPQPIHLKPCLTGISQAIGIWRLLKTARIWSKDIEKSPFDVYNQREIIEDLIFLSCPRWWTFIFIEHKKPPKVKTTSTNFVNVVYLKKSSQFEITGNSVYNTA